MKKEEARILGRVEGKVDSLIIDLKAIRKGSEHKIEILSTRVGNLEKKQFAVIAFASAIFAVGLTFLKKFSPF